MHWRLAEKLLRRLWNKFTNFTTILNAIENFVLLGVQYALIGTKKKNALVVRLEAITRARLARLSFNFPGSVFCGRFDFTFILQTQRN